MVVNGANCSPYTYALSRLCRANADPVGAPTYGRLHSRKYTGGLMWCNFTSRVTRSSPTVYTCGLHTHAHSRRYTGSIRNLNFPARGSSAFRHQSSFFFRFLFFFFFLFRRWQSNTPARNLLPTSSSLFFFPRDRVSKGCVARIVAVPRVFNVI